MKHVVSVGAVRVCVAGGGGGGGGGFAAGCLQLDHTAVDTDCVLNAPIGCMSPQTAAHKLLPAAINVQTEDSSFSKQFNSIGTRAKLYFNIGFKSTTKH